MSKSIFSLAVLLIVLAWCIPASPLAGSLPPGREYAIVPVRLHANWGRKSDSQPLKLTAGKHTVRIAFLGRRADAVASPIHAVSNPVSIEILEPADARKEMPPISPDGYREHVAGLVLPQNSDRYVANQQWVKEHLAGAIPFLLEVQIRHKTRPQSIPEIPDLLFEAWQQGILGDQQKH